MELSDNQRLYLQTIFDYFHDHGKWPTYKYVDRKLIQIRRDLDIETISKSLPMGFANAFALNHDLNADAVLSIAAISVCRDSEEDLADFIRALIFCVETYFSAEEDTVEISSDDLVQQLNMPDLSIRKVGLLIKDAYEHPIYHVFGSKDTEYKGWVCTLSRNIRYFDGVTSIEKYLERLDQLRRPSSATVKALKYLGRIDLPRSLSPATVKDRSDLANENNLQITKYSNRSRAFTLATRDALRFQALIGELLQALGFIDVVEPKGRDEGYDFQASYPINFAPGVTTQQSWIVEVKYVHSRMTSTDRTVSVESLRQLIAYSLVKKADKALLVTNTVLTSFAKEVAIQINAETENKLEVWDIDKISSLLSGFPELQSKYASIISTFPPSSSKPLDTNRVTLIEHLAQCQPGQQDCHKFEDVCLAILTEVFVPPLKPPKRQSRTLNGLERRDALFPIRGAKRGWEEIRQDFDANFLLCEFKNYTEPFSKDEVNQTRNYLKDTIGRIGLIFSRRGASESALRMRNIVYTQERKVILFLEDKHLVELLKMKEADKNPLDLIQDAIDEFYLSYE
jgi:hypothetical protein